MEKYYRFKMLHWQAMETRDAAERVEKKARRRIHSVDSEQRAVKARALADEALAALRRLNHEDSSKPRGLCAPSSRSR